MTPWGNTSVFVTGVGAQCSVTPTRGEELKQLVFVLGVKGSSEMVGVS